MIRLVRIASFALALGLAPLAWSQDQSTSSFVEQAAEINAAEVEMSEMAQDRAESEDVKYYARMLEQEHELASERLQQIAEGQNVELPSEPNERQRAQAQRLSELEGAAFDRAYLDAQVEAHQQAIELFEQQAGSEQNPEVQTYAEMHLPSLKEHLEQAQLLQEKTQAR